MKKMLLLLSFMSASAFSMELDRISYADNANKMYIQPFLVRSPERLGEFDLYHSKKGFYVRKNDKKKTIQRYNMDPMLRGITKTQLRAFLDNGYLSVNKMEDGQYSLQAKGRLNGSGPIGAAIGVFLGKATVSIVGHGAIQLVALASGPLYFPVMVGLESTLGVAIEKASIAGAIAGGITLGSITGPV